VDEVILIVVWVCISLINRDFEHFSYTCWTFVLSSFGKCLFRLFEIFLNRLVVLLLLNYSNSLYVLDINSLWIVWLAHTFSCSIGCLFTVTITLY
jgi:hypothetical protein